MILENKIGVATGYNALKVLKARVAQFAQCTGLLRNIIQLINFGKRLFIFL